MKYTVLDKDMQTVESSVRQFLETLPYVIVAGGYLPPLIVLNSILASGELDAGMSGAVQWDPFSLSDAEYDDLASWFCSKSRCRIVDTPDWVTDYQTWSIFLLERERGVPAAEHLALARELEELEEKRDRAYDAGSIEKARELDARAGIAGANLSRFVSKFLINKD